MIVSMLMSEPYARIPVVRELSYLAKRRLAVPYCPLLRSGDSMEDGWRRVARGRWWQDEGGLTPPLRSLDSDAHAVMPLPSPHPQPWHDRR